MHLLRGNFRLFTLCGCWLPEACHSAKWTTALYNCYSLELLILDCPLISMKIISASAKSFSNVQQFAEEFVGFVQIVCGLLKSIAIYRQRRPLFVIERCFPDCIRNNERKEEIEIHDWFDKIARLGGHSARRVCLKMAEKFQIADGNFKNHMQNFDCRLLFEQSRHIGTNFWLVEMAIISLFSF